MFTEQAIQKIVDLGNNEIKEIAGTQFHVGPKGADALKFPEPKAVSLFSLTQVVSYAKLQKAADIFINVVNATTVYVMERARNENQNHGLLADAAFGDVVDEFNEDRRYTQDEFIVQLLTKFEDNYDRRELQKLVSTMKAEKIKTSDDDGFSQVASTKAGVVLGTETKVKNLFDLRPFKTFPEIKQPSVPHVLRLHQRDNEMPQFGLYSADGESWRIDATIAVRTYLQEQLGEGYLIL